MSLNHQINNMNGLSIQNQIEKSTVLHLLLFVKNNIF